MRNSWGDFPAPWLLTFQKFVFFLEFLNFLPKKNNAFSFWKKCIKQFYSRLDAKIINLEFWNFGVSFFIFWSDFKLADDTTTCYETLWWQYGSVLCIHCQKWICIPKKRISDLAKLYYLKWPKLGIYLFCFPTWSTFYWKFIGMIFVSAAELSGP